MGGVSRDVVELICLVTAGSVIGFFWLPSNTEWRDRGFLPKEADYKPSPLELVPIKVIAYVIAELLVFCLVCAVALFGITWLTRAQASNEYHAGVHTRFHVLAFVGGLGIGKYCRYLRWTHQKRIRQEGGGP